MARSNSHETADILVRELGAKGALAYAEKIAAYDGPLSAEYADAARIIHSIFGNINIADSLKSFYDGKFD